jgi:phosphate transport system substrate-binding protein
MKKIGVKAIIKIIVSVIFGLAISYFLAEIVIDEYYNRHYIDNPLFFVFQCVIYLSIILFLILWNIIKSKFVYLLLTLPIICIAAEIIIPEYKLYKYAEYQKSIENIPAVDEYGINIYEYWPFSTGNLLVKLDEAPDLEITDNMPILDGATAFFPIYASFLQAVYPEGKYSRLSDLLLCSRTEWAYKNLLEGKADIIFCLEPSDLQIKQFNDKGVKLKLIPIGREAFVFFVNKETPINNVTIENIRGIYSGKIRNWKKLNGINQNILAYQRPKNSGSQTILEKIMGDTSIIKPRKEYVQSEMGGIIKMVAEYRNFPNALGYSFLHYSTEMVKNDQIKLLSIDGIYPSVESIQDGSYPFIEDFYAIYIDSDNKNENIDSFIEWILSRQGQTIILKTGYIPIMQGKP